MEGSVDPLIIPGHVSKLSKELFQLQQRGDFCDITMETKSGSISAHKIVLIASGSKFLQEQIYKATSMGQLMCNINLKKELYNDVLTVVKCLYTGELDSEYHKSQSLCSLLQLLDIDYQHVQNGKDKGDNLLSEGAQNGQNKGDNLLSEGAQNGQNKGDNSISKVSSETELCFDSCRPYMYSNNINSACQESIKANVSVLTKTEAVADVDSEPLSELCSIELTNSSQVGDSDLNSEYKNVNLYSIQDPNGRNLTISLRQNESDHVVIVSKNPSDEQNHLCLENTEMSERNVSTSNVRNNEQGNVNLSSGENDDVMDEDTDVEGTTSKKKPNYPSKRRKSTLKRKRSICNVCESIKSKCKCKTKSTGKKMSRCKNVGKKIPKLDVPILPEKAETICSECNLNLTECTCKHNTDGRKQEKNICIACKIKFPSQKDRAEHESTVHNHDNPQSTKNTEDGDETLGTDESKKNSVLISLLKNSAKSDLVNKPCIKMSDQAKKCRIKEKKPRKMQHCTQCTYSTLHWSNFKRHLLTHEEKPTQPLRNPTLCDQCGKSFTSKFGLALHKKNKHELEFKYVCQKCERGFNQSIQFKSHCLNCQGVTKEKCSVCEAEFNSVKLLKRHMLVCKTENDCDKNDKLHKCSLCKLSYNSKSTLWDHVRGVHGAPSYKCLECGKKYAWRSSLKAHTKFAHSNTTYE